MDFAPNARLKASSPGATPGTNCAPTSGKPSKRSTSTAQAGQHSASFGARRNARSWMKIPLDLSGHDLVTVLCRHWGARVNQVGSTSFCRRSNRLHTASLFPHTKRCVLERSMVFCEPWRITSVWVDKRFLTPWRESGLSPLGSWPQPPVPARIKTEDPKNETAKAAREAQG